MTVLPVSGPSLLAPRSWLKCLAALYPLTRLVFVWFTCRLVDL
jgi:hypothetical protein